MTWASVKAEVKAAYDYAGPVQFFLTVAALGLFAVAAVAVVVMMFVA